MAFSVTTEVFSPPPFSLSKAAYYLGIPDPKEETELLCQEALAQLEPNLSYRVCYTRFPCSITEVGCDLGFTKFPSHNLARALRGCEEGILFCATLGVGVDRLIAKYKTVSPARALVINAVATERIEAFCDAFCQRIREQEGTGARVKPRYSPGFGDLPLTFQKTIFSVLEPERRIGVTLNDHCFMTPAKSVTALVGISKGGEIK